MSPQDGSCQKLRNCVCILCSYAEKNSGLFFRTRCSTYTYSPTVITYTRTLDKWYCRSRESQRTQFIRKMNPYKQRPISELTAAIGTFVWRLTSTLIKRYVRSQDSESGLDGFAPPLTTAASGYSISSSPEHLPLFSHPNRMDYRLSLCRGSHFCSLFKFSHRRPILNY